MPDRRIELTVDGLDSEDGHVLLPDLVAWLQRQHNVLVDFDRIVGKGKRANKFRVVDLSHESPATAVVEVFPTQKDNDLSEALVERYVAAIDRIESGNVPEDLDANTLKNLKELAAPVGKRLKRATVRSGNTVVEFSERFAANIDEALARVERSIGSVEGVVERFNAHDGANVFFIYPSVGPGLVRCYFPNELKKKAAESVLHKARVTGELVYLRHSDFPHEINVADIEIYEEDDDLPAFADLRGAAPDATGELMSEEFIRSERHAWED